MTSQFPKITIITVCLNPGKLIEQSVQSVLRQTFKDLQYIIIDGGSKDGTIDLLQKYQDQNALEFISEEDGGIYFAMNKGISNAKGEWIYFLGSDDVFFDDEVLERIFQKPYGQEEILYGNVQYLHSGIIYDGPFNHEKISRQNICHQALFVKRNVFDKIGNFDTRYKICADMEFNIRWMGKKIRSTYINELIVIYNELGLSGQVVDEVFLSEFDDILINNNIVSLRSFNELKRRHERVEQSYSYKVGHLLIAPFRWLKSKFLHFNNGRS